MHVPDGFIDVQTSAAFGAASAAGVAVSLRGARKQLDGGLTALGLNVFNMALVGVWSSYLVFLVVKSLLPKNRGSITACAFIAGLVSVPLSAVSFVGQYWLGGSGAFGIGAVFAAMFGTHVLIGIGEAVITSLTVGAVLSSRQDLVFGWKSSTLAGARS